MTAKFLEDLVKVLGIGAGFASIPFFASLAGLQPPWPPAIGHVSAAIVLVAALTTWEWTRRGPVKSRRRWIVIGLGVVLVALSTYLYLYSQFTDPIPGLSGRAIRGYECTEAARLVYGNACPDLPSDALQSAGWDSTELWTRSSLTNVRLLLAGTWLLFTSGLVLSVAGVIAGRKA